MPYNHPPLDHPSALFEKKQLVWTLDGISNREEAIQFLMLFENTFPVYHPYMEQIYFRYTFVIADDSNQIIIEPDYQIHERLTHIAEDAFSARKMHILPGDVVGKQGIYMRSPRKSKRRISREVTSKLGTAIKALYFESWMKGEQVIPLFSRQAIREYDEGMPNMELLFYNLKLNDRLSPFLRESILATVFDRILALEIV